MEYYRQATKKEQIQLSYLIQSNPTLIFHYSLLFPSSWNRYPKTCVICSMQSAIHGIVGILGITTELKMSEIALAHPHLIVAQK